MINQDQRDYLGEARLIAEGNTCLLPERVHVQVLWSLYQTQQQVLKEIADGLGRMLPATSEDEDAN